MSYTVSQLLTQDITFQPIEIKGWVRTFRANRFIALNDGSTLHNIQCVVDFENTEEAYLKANHYWCSSTHKRRIG